MAEVVGVADGHHEIAHRQLVGIAEGQLAQVLAFDFQQGDVRGRIAAHQLGLELAPVLQRHADVVGVVDDVVVGHHMPCVGVDDDAGAAALPLAETRQVAEELAQARVRAHAHAHLDVDHRRGDFRQHRREGELAVVRGRAAGEEAERHGGEGGESSHGLVHSCVSCCRFRPPARRPRLVLMVVGGESSIPRPPGVRD